MDEVDTAILRVLREEARTPVAEVARRVGVTRATVHERLKRLTEAGILQGTTVRLDPAALGLALRAFILVQWRSDAGPDQREVAQSIARIPGVERVHNVTGTHDFLVEALARDMDSVGRLIVERMRAIPGVGPSETMIAFWSYEGQGIPLDGTTPAR